MRKKKSWYLISFQVKIDDDGVNAIQNLLAGIVEKSMKLKDCCAVDVYPHCDLDDDEDEDVCNEDSTKAWFTVSFQAKLSEKDIQNINDRFYNVLEEELGLVGCCALDIDSHCDQDDD